MKKNLTIPFWFVALFLFIIFVMMHFEFLIDNQRSIQKRKIHKTMREHFSNKEILLKELRKEENLNRRIFFKRILLKCIFLGILLLLFILFYHLIKRSYNFDIKRVLSFIYDEKEHDLRGICHIELRNIAKNIIEKNTKITILKNTIEKNDSKVSIFLNNIDSGIIIVDINDIIVEINFCMLRLLEYSRKNTKGKNFITLFQDILPEIITHIERFKNSFTPQIIEIQKKIHHKDIKLQLQPIYKRQFYVGFLLNAIDITELVQARKISEYVSSELRSTLTELKLSLATSEQLRIKADTAKENFQKAARLAEAANKSKTDFLANMSHEIRTPMNGVLGMAELLINTELNYEQREYTKTILTSTKNLLNIINDILDVSKIEAGKLHLEETNFNLLNIIEEVGLMLVAKAKERNVELINRYASDVPQCFLGDPIRIRQIITNLVANAIKFTVDGQVITNVECRYQDEQEATIEIKIIDTGIGIAIEKQHILFQKFSQAEASTTRRFGGTGLGLSICKHLVKIMNGQIGFRSIEGKGSTFYFTLKLKKDKKETTAYFQTEPDFSGTKIMIVAKNQVNRNIIMEKLSAWKMKCYDSDNIDETIRLVKLCNKEKKHFDIVIVDYGLENIDNFVSRLHEINSDTHILAFTFPGVKNAEDFFKDKGFSGYLTKPLRISQLIDTIKPFCKKVKKISEKFRSPSSSFIKINAKTLLVEDNIINQKVAIGILQKFTDNIDVAFNGKEALDYYKKNAYDIILMDCQMPEMNGFEATKEIRKLENGKKKTPIIAMTGNAMIGDKEKCINAGMDWYIPKPISINTIKEAILRFIDLT